MSASPSPREHLAAFATLAPRATRAAWVGGIVLAIGLAVTAMWTLSTKRLYRSDAVIFFERGVQSASVGSGSEGDSPRQVATRLQEMVTARQRLEKLIKSMKLYPAVVEQHSMVDAIDEMRKHLNVGSREGYTFKISYDSDSREQAQAVLDRLTRDIVDEDARRRVRDAEETKKFLDTEREHADADLKKKESALAAFLAQHPQLAAESGSGAAAAGGLIRAADRDRAPASSGGEIAALELQAAQLEEALSAAGQRPNAGPTEAPIDPLLGAARARASTELQAAQRDLADKQARFTNEHPDVKAALRRVADAEAAVRRADAALASPHPAGGGGTAVAASDDSGGRVGALRRALAAVRAQIGSLRSRGGGPRVEVPRQVSSVVAIDTEWTRLSREVSEARERQQQLEAKQFQAQLVATLASGGQGGRLVIADPAFRPTKPVAGGRFKIALVGGAASVLMGLLAIAALAAFDDRMYGARDVERVVNDGIVVVIPRLTEKGG